MRNDDEELFEILQQTSHSNIRNSITGLLVYRDGVFLEKLEGEKAAVLATFERIRKDSRHSHVTKLHEGEIDSRSFLGYNMCFETDFEKTIRQVGGYVNRDEATDLLTSIENPSPCVIQMLTMMC